MIMIIKININITYQQSVSIVEMKKAACLPMCREASKYLTVGKGRRKG
jgi:hypothetical protein